MEGQTLSHYKVLERLGGGGMGVVYKALDTRLNRPVALKFLPPELTRDDQARQRFVQEAQAASALDHPNICTIYEIDTSPDGQMFIAMAFYEGETLKKRIERGSLKVEETLQIANQIALGLERAHESGIIHRDIKPSNVMLTRRGEAKIVDFGIAKLMGVTGPTQTGTTLGTVAYMSPEQINGEEADKQTDLWSLGAVLYEMLAGQTPFQGEHQLVLMNAIVNQTPKPLRALRTEIPTEVERLVTRALEKQREARYGSATEFLKESTECYTMLTRPISTPAKFASPWQAMATPKVVLAALLVILVIGAGAIWSWSRGADARWARTEGIPQIMQLIEEDSYGAAFELAEEAAQHIPNDPILAGLWPEMSALATIITEPSGADVFVKAYGDLDDGWTLLGQTPLENFRFPRGTYQWRLEKEGFEPQSLATNNPSPLLNNYRASGRDIGRTVPLLPVGEVPSSMVFVPESTGLVSVTGFNLAPVTLDAFFIDRTEVTNRDFKQFVDGDGYENPEYWAGLEFVKDGRPLTWQEAMFEFRDSTGRPGPATWEAGDYPNGRADYPVTGVSWYEANAYTRFRERSLPTVVHWNRAALSTSEIASPLGPAMVSRSNFSGDQVAPVATYPGVGPYGTYDMAGNVREWTWNAAGDGDSRITLGGAWSDAEYMFSIAYPLPPFDRSPINGLRLMKRSDDAELSAALTAPINVGGAGLDPERLRPVSDEVFEVLTQQFTYDRTDLDVTVDSVDESFEAWITERVSLDSGYGAGRMSVLLYLPKHVEPPYQTVVFFPGVGPFQPNGSRSSEGLQLTTPFTTFAPMDLIVRSGRALVWPIYWGSFERYSNEPFGPGQRLIRWRSDLGRTIDYLETRQDIQADGLGYLGWSFGASAAVPLLALEDRLRAAVLQSGGLGGGGPRRVGINVEINNVANYLPRITIPVLMLSGRFDYLFPLETRKQPMFDLLGTPPGEKRHVIFESGHVPLPRHQSMRETLDWLDQYLGPVN